MFTQEKLTVEARKVALERLGAGMVKDILVSDYIDAGGDKAFEAIVVLAKYDPTIVTVEAMSAISLHLIRALDDDGDGRWVYVRYIPEDELAEILADA